MWLLLAVALALPALALEVPQLWGRIVDQADLIPPETEQRIEAELEAVEKATGAQIAVLTVPSLEGESLEDYSLQVVEQWKLGRAGHDDGVLLLIARDDRLMRLEIGYGLEATITDATSGRILDGVLRPRFRAGEFGTGIEEGVHAVAELVQGRELPPEALADTASGSSRRFNPVPLVIGLFVMQLLSSVRGKAGWVLYGIGIPAVLALASALGTMPRAALLTLAWIVLFPLMRLWGRSSGRRGGWSSRGGGYSSGGGGWSSGGGSSSGGFSGGGGSFGGGGSSSSW